MTLVLSEYSESSHISTPLKHTDPDALVPVSVAKINGQIVSSSPSSYYNSRGESIVDFTLELELIRNCLGKIALQRQTFERRASIDSYSTYSSAIETDSDIEGSSSSERKALPTNVTFLLKELDSCLDNGKRYREYRSKTGSNETENAGNINKAQMTDKEYEVKSRNLWITQENIAKVSSRFATSFKSAITDSVSNSTSASIASKSNYAQRHLVTLSEVYITASWAGWVSKFCVINHLFVPRKTWKRRYFVLTPKALYRFKSSAPSAVSLEPIQITGNTVASVSEKFLGQRWVIGISNPHHPTCYIQVESLEELKIWLSSIKYTIIQRKYSFCQFTPKTSHEKGNLRGSTATSSTIASNTSTLLGPNVEKPHKADIFRLPKPTPMPNYPPPSPPIQQKSLYLPSLNSTIEPTLHRSLLQRVNILSRKETIRASKTTARRLLILDSNSTILINTNTPDSLPFAAVEATY